MPIRPWILTTGVALVLALGCSAGQSGEPDLESWTFNGTWRGGFADGTTNLTAVLHLTEQDSLLLGNGVISGSGIECQVTIDGSRHGERVALDLLCPPYAPIRFRGDRSGATKIRGTVQGSGIPPNEMDLIKQ